jgi:hypothetical protein
MEEPQQPKNDEPVKKRRYNLTDKKYHREYYIKNRGDILRKQKIYKKASYIKNQEAIKAKQLKYYYAKKEQQQELNQT